MKQGMIWWQWYIIYDKCAKNGNELGSITPRRRKIPKSKNEFVGVNIAPLLPLFCLQNPHFSTPKFMQILIMLYLPYMYANRRKIFVSFKKTGWRNMMVTSDFRKEVERWPFAHAQWKICNIASIYHWVLHSYWLGLLIVTFNRGLSYGAYTTFQWTYF